LALTEFSLKTHLIDEQAKVERLAKELDQYKKKYDEVGRGIERATSVGSLGPFLRD
jgi:uncharacterized protein YlxW (UPF0749 family)